MSEDQQMYRWTDEWWAKAAMAHVNKAVGSLMKQWSLRPLTQSNIPMELGTERTALLASMCVATWVCVYKVILWLKQRTACTYSYMCLNHIQYLIWKQLSQPGQPSFFSLQEATIPLIMIYGLWWMSDCVSGIFSKCQRWKKKFNCRN